MFGLGFKSSVQGERSGGCKGFGLLRVSDSSLNRVATGP